MSATPEEKILVNHTPWWTRVAVKEGDRLVDYEFERMVKGPRFGDIFKGKVLNVLPGLQAAFVNIGAERPGYLYIDDVVRESGERRIKNVLQEGQEIIVQVIREGENDKGPKLSMKISIPGRYLVYLPYENDVRISSKITDKSVREQLVALVSSLMEELPGAFIIRTSAAFATEDEIRHEAESISHEWDELLHKAVNTNAPALLRRERRLVERVIREYVKPSTKRIVVDSQEALDVLARELHFWPSAEVSVELYSGDKPLFQHERVEDELHQVLHRRIKLPSGGFLIIEEMEAFTGIDVNTGSHTGDADFESTAFRINTEAAKEIMRVLRLRNISGLIIIDFLNMKKEAHQRKILNIIKEESLKDTAKITFRKFSELGIVEMTRRKTERSLKHEMTFECPQCHGTGSVISPRYVASRILAELLWTLKSKKREKIKITVHPEVKDYLLSHHGKELLELGKEFDTDVIVMEKSGSEIDAYRFSE